MVRQFGKRTCDLRDLDGFRKLTGFRIGNGERFDKAGLSQVSQGNGSGGQLHSFLAVAQFRFASHREKPSQIIQYQRVVGIDTQSIPVLQDGFSDFPPLSS